MAKNLESAHIVVKGRVQGVFYRATTVEVALKMGITGWVRNMGDGGVEIMAEGKRETLEKFIKWCRQGPPMARVTLVEVDWQPATGAFDNFETEY